MAGQHRWPQQREQRLIELWEECDADGKWAHSRVQVAERMGVSECTVIGKLNRLIAAGRTGVRHRTVARGPSSGAAVLAEAQARTAAQARPPAAPAPSRPRFIVLPAVPPPRACQWPLWGNEPVPRPPRFCEAALRPDSPYCAAHSKLAFTGSYNRAILAAWG